MPRVQKPYGLSVPQAIELHDSIANDENMAFNYLYDGCAFRTHIIGHAEPCRKLSLKKAWAFAQGQHYLTYTAPCGFTKRWGYHVSPLIPVFNAKTGQSRDMIFDPMLFDGPVLPYLWRSKFAAKGTRVFIRNWGERPPGQKGNLTPNFDYNDSTLKQATSQLESYARRPEIKHRMVYSSPLKKAFAKTLKCPKERAALFKGHLWESEHFRKMVGDDGIEPPTLSV